LARVAAAPVGRLATLRPDDTSAPPGSGAVDLVPFVFAWLPEPLPFGRLVHAVDHKPKRHQRLQRLANVVAHPDVTVLVDHYEDDWTRLWWVRLRGTATVLEVADALGLGALVAKYPAYRDRPPTGSMMSIRLDDVRGWSAG
jgi:PPOX class probable F420-dependent enzyme